ncbi:MAG: PAS domain-containing protein [Candidatus Omnitrophota bacterium]
MKLSESSESAMAKEIQYRTLIENLPGKVFLKDRNSVYVSCNENYAKDLKIKPEEIAGKTDYDFFPKHLAEKYRADDKRVMESGETENIEEEYMMMKDFLRGTHKAIISIVKAPVRDKDGNVTGLFGLFWDITERRNMEDALKASERKIRAIFDQTFQFIGLMTTEGILIEANMAALNFAGIKASEVINKPFWKTPWWKHSPELQGKLREAVKRVAMGDIVRFDATHIAKDGSVHTIDFSLKPVKDDNGKIIFMIPEGRDITDRKLLEEKLRKADASKAVAEIKSRLIYMVSHELKAPMTAIKKSINLVLEDPAGGLNDKQKNGLSAIKGNIDRLDRLIGNVLNFQKTEEGGYGV